MKKIFVFVFLLLVILCFSSCDKLNSIINGNADNPTASDNNTVEENNQSENPPIEHEHIFGEWQYDDSSHWCSWDCNLDACDIDTYDEHYDKDSNGYCDACGYKSPEHIHTKVWTIEELAHSFSYTCGCVTEPNSDPHSDFDRDGLCDYCGYEMGENHPVKYLGDMDGHAVITLCGCCDAPVVIEPHVDEDLDEMCDLCDRMIMITEEIPLTQYEPWLDEIAAEGVTEIITYSLGGWISPDLQTIISTKSKDIIEQIIDEYRQVVVLKNDWINYEQLPGSFEIEFYLTDGSVKKLVFQGGGHFFGRYPVNNTPSLDREEFVDVDRRYSVTTYRRFEQIYSHDMMSSLTEGIRVSRINPEMLEFVECKCEPTSDLDSYSRFYYYIETDEGRITFFDEGKHLMIDGKMYDVINFDRINLSGINTVKSAHEEKFNDGRIAFVENYYGIFDSGAVVAMVNDDKTGYDDALWSESVAGYTINYPNGNRIVVLYDGEFYTLPEAYENGYLTNLDIYAIWRLRN